MKISYNWLKDYIKINYPVDKLTDILTHLGLEVSKVEKYHEIRGGMEGLLIGKVVACEKHPNADRLSLTKVDIGGNNLLSIVCGASNVSTNKKVVVAPVGTKLFKDDESFTIKRTKIRGEMSEGMICSEDEIGMGEDQSGIMILPDKAKVGIPAKDYFKIVEDNAIEIDLTPNRIDAASHIGVARDLAAYFWNNTNLTYTKPSVNDFSIDENTDNIKVEIKNTDACQRYTGLCLKNIKIVPSPTWLQNRLKTIGLTPVNNVVDVTNYVLFETGQPLHAFDRKKIKSNKVVVQTLLKNTKFTTLDGIMRYLDENDLMICDDNSPMCMAGVFGGINSGVNDNTTSIFLESAFFDSVYNRKSAKRHNLLTEASYRFERGVDINQTIYALKRAALLLKEITGAVISSEIIDVYPEKVKNSAIKLELKYLEKLIGIKIPSNTIKKILNKLEIKILEETKNYFRLEIPYYRVDVTRPADIVEEILRIYGYNNIPLKQKLNANLNISDEVNEHLIERKIASYFSNQGFFEIINNSLTKASYLNLIDFNIGNIALLNNPLSNDLNALRQTLLFGGLENISYNQNRQHKNLKFFEFGNVYRSELNISNMKTLDNFKENKLLGVFLVGNENEKNWHKQAKKHDIFHLKAHVKNVIRLLGIPINNLQIKYLNQGMFIRGLAYFLNDFSIVNLGQINKQILSELSIESDVYYAEIKWEILLKLLSFKEINIKPLPKYPYVIRDLSLLLKKEIEFKNIKNLAFKTLPGILKEVILFDVYEGANLGENNKSYAISFILQDENKTLTDKLIDAIMNKLIKVFNTEFQAIIR